MWTKIYLTTIIMLMFNSPLMAAKNAGVILMLNGPSEIFVKPSSSPNGPGPRVHFNGKYYQIKKAKIGQRLKWNEVIRTSPTSKLKISFKNGDSIFVGPGTAYSLADSKKSQKKKTKSKGQILNLLYGKMRAVVSKKGPRNNLRIKTKSSVAGVRGTDFYVSYNPTSSQTEFCVLRGAVEVKPKNAQKTMHVKSGQYAVLKKAKIQKNTSKFSLPDKEEESKVVDLYGEKLLEIQSASNVKKEEAQLAELSEETRKEITEIETKTKEVVVEDIKDENREFFEQVKEASSMDAETLNKAVVARLYKKAPTKWKKKKISEGELKNILGEDVYKGMKSDDWK